MTSPPRLFRLNVEVADIEAATTFYTALLGVAGRRQAGGRTYFPAGPVTLQVLEVGEVSPLPKSLYFAVDDLPAVHARAQALGCLSTLDVHGASGGKIVVRPWGERSFYADDPWGNSLCFVEAGTIFQG